MRMSVIVQKKKILTASRKQCWFGLQCSGPWPQRRTWQCWKKTAIASLCPRSSFGETTIRSVSWSACLPLCHLSQHLYTSCMFKQLSVSWSACLPLVTCLSTCIPLERLLFCMFKQPVVCHLVCLLSSCHLSQHLYTSYFACLNSQLLVSWSACLPNFHLSQHLYTSYFACLNSQLLISWSACLPHFHLSQHLYTSYFVCLNCQLSISFPIGRFRRGC